jgi:hypothetical protein
MLSLKATLLTLPLLIAAQNSTVNLFLLDTDPQQLVASIITANPTTTQWEITCPSSVDSNDCGYRPAITVGEKSGSIWGASLTAPGEQFTVSYECTLYSSSGTSAVCVQSLGGEQANDPGVTTTTLTGSEIQFYPATVTAGAEKLSGTKVTSTGSGSGSRTGSVVTLTGTAATTGSATGTGASATATKSSSGAGGVRISGAFGAGVVLALVLAVL